MSFRKVLILLLLIAPTLAWAQEESDFEGDDAGADASEVTPPTESALPGTEPPAAPESPKPTPRRSGNSSSRSVRAREKKVEGTKALNRLKADPVLKSRYTLDGRPLDVDPD